MNLLNVKSFVRQEQCWLKGALRCILCFPVIERFCLPPDAKVKYKDATGTEVDEDIFSDLVSQGSVALTVFSNDGEKCKGVNYTIKWCHLYFFTNLSIYSILYIDRFVKKTSGV